MSIKTAVITILPPILRKYTARIEASPLGYRLAKGAFWSLTGALISRGLGLISSIWVARMLGKEGFGELGIIQNTVGMFGTFAGFGMGLTATKYIAEFKIKDPDKAGRIMSLSGLVAIITGGIISIALVVFAPWLAKNTLAAPHLSRLLQISTGLLFLTALNGSQTGALAGFEAFKTIAQVNLWAGITAFPLMVGGVYMAGLEGAIWGLLASMGINWLLNHIALRIEARKAKIPFSYRGCMQEWKVVWTFSLPSVLAGAMVGPVNWACSAMLVNQPSGYAEMGVFNAILRIKQVPEMILSIIMMPLLPVLSEQFGTKATQSYNKTLSYAFAVSLLVIVPISLIQMAIPSLTLLPYGREFQGNYVLVQWMMLHAVLVGLFQPFGSILPSMNRMWFGWAYNLSWGGVYLLLSYFLIPVYGVTGLAAATFFTHLTTSLVCVAYIYRFEKAFISEIPLSYSMITVLFLSEISVATFHLISSPMSGVIGILVAFLCISILYRRFCCL